MPRSIRHARAAPGWGRARIFAIGHSTRRIEELIDLLVTAGALTVADVRTIPGSRAHPQFGKEALSSALNGAGIRYAHLHLLGGLRRPRPDSMNLGWRNSSFRGYADHMATPQFEQGLCELRTLAKDGPVALLCAEAVPWRCHRSLLADALLARGVVVEHLVGRGRTLLHRMTPFARVEGRTVTYPADPLPKGMPSGPTTHPAPHRPGLRPF